jgi:Tol biopolymer transport system component
MRRIISLAIAAVAVLVVAIAGQAHGIFAPAAVAASGSGVGSRIAFSTDRDGREAPDEIYVMNSDGTGETRLTVTPSGNSLFPEWSPDGKMIALHNNLAEIGGPEIFLINADGTGLTRLTYMTDLGLGAVNATWSPDGKWIAFNSFVIRDIYVINVDGTGLTQLTSDPANEASPDWSPDGRTIAFNSNRDGDAEIYVMSTDDPHHWLKLTDNSATDMGADWSPDGRKIAFESQRDGNREIYIMNADGSEQARLTCNAVIDAFPSWSPDGQRIAFHRQVTTLPGLDPPNGSEIFVVEAGAFPKDPCGDDPPDETQVTHHTPDSFSAFASWAPGHAKEGQP